MPKPALKSRRIRNYLRKNPGATWKVAQSSLEKYGITANYFSMQKGKFKEANMPEDGAPAAEGETTESSAEANTSGARGGRGVSKKRGRPAKSGSSAGGGNLAQAAEFARTVGGIEQAKGLLQQLAEFQVKG